MMSFLSLSHPPHISLLREVILVYARVVIGEMPFSSPFTRWSTGFFCLGEVAVRVAEKYLIKWEAAL